MRSHHPSGPGAHGEPASTGSTGSTPSHGVRSGQRPGGRLASAARAVSAAFGALLGLLPHLLHHAGILAGAALVTGLGGNLVLGLVGLLFSVPLFRRLYRRFGTWKAPAVAAVIFAGMFALSALVIGPAISGETLEGTPQQAPSSSPSASHSGHHGG